MTQFRVLRVGACIVCFVLLALGVVAVQAVQNDWDEIYIQKPIAGYALFENTDAGSYTDANAQSVNLVAPSAFPNSSRGTYFLNNVMTDQGYFIQAGLEFYKGTGRVVWTDDSFGLHPQDYSPIIPYVASHTYRFTISYWSGHWWMCGQDNAVPSSYTCHPETKMGANGTHLNAEVNTSIWVETNETLPNWYSGFSSPFQAWGALIYRNQVGQDWTTQHRHTMDSCPFTGWPAQNALSGSLTGGQTGLFTLSGVPLDCPASSYLPFIAQ
jgi:hypothetical protein